jgi:ribosomal protein L32
MLSFSKILFTALIIVVVWQGFKLFNRGKQVSSNEQPKQASHDKKSSSKPVAHELEKCPNCGVYHAEGNAHRCEG